MGWHGVYREIDAPNSITSTEIFEGFPDAESVNTMTLTETDGDFDKAVELLRVKGAAKAANRAAERDASAGLVATSGGALVELKCETDFVAKGDVFIAAAQRIADAADAAGAPEDYVHALRRRACRSTGL